MEEVNEDVMFPVSYNVRVEETNVEWLKTKGISPRPTDSLL